jgi:hypothetical protein
MKFATTLAMAALAVAAPAFAGDDDWFDHDHCRYQEARNLTTPATGVTRVIIHADAGSLNVEGRPGVSQIGVTGQACTSDEDFLPRMTLIARRSGGDLYITATIPDKKVLFGWFQARLDFAVTIPAGLPVMIEDASGWMKVSGTGPTEIEDDSGSIDIRDVRGTLRISDDSGSIKINDVHGNVTIEDDSGEITVRRVNGNVEIEDDSGAITVADVEGSLTIPDDQSGAISVFNVKRNVLINEDGSGLIEVADIGGDFTVHRKGSGSIDYERVAGKVSVPRRDRD